MQGRESKIKARKLVAPVLANAVVAGLSAWLFGGPLAWTSERRDEFSSMIGDGLPFVQFICLAFLVDRLVGRFFTHMADASAGGRQIPRLAQQLLSVLVYFAFLAASVRFVFNESVGTLLAASGVVGLAVGWGMRGLLADIFSGIALHLDGMISEGDWIDISVRGVNFHGRVVEVMWRNVALADRMENLVYVPNREFASAAIVNRSRPLNVTEYSVPLPIDGRYERSRVMSVLENGLARAVADGVLLAAPAPYLRISGVEGGAVVYVLYYYIDPRKVSPPKARTAALSRTIDSLNAAGMRLYAIQHNEITRPRQPGQDRLTELDARHGVLAAVPLFDVLSSVELADLAEHSELYSVAKGETVMLQGEPGDTMVVVVEGRLAVHAADHSQVATLWPGECAGEMSLLTGAPRSATVVAATTSWLIKVPKAALTPILHANPALIQQFAATMECRRAAVPAAADAASKGASAGNGDGFVARIRSFFRL